MGNWNHRATQHDAQTDLGLEVMASQYLVFCGPDFQFLPGWESLCAAVHEAERLGLNPIVFVRMPSGTLDEYKYRREGPGVA